jgi:hypothetical protein
LSMVAKKVNFLPLSYQQWKDGIPAKGRGLHFVGHYKNSSNFMKLLTACREKGMRDLFEKWLA